ncbi:MAG: CAP domain-containing protein [Alteraurantiacibacter sp.]
MTERLILPLVSLALLASCGPERLQSTPVMVGPPRTGSAPVALSQGMMQQVLLAEHNAARAAVGVGSVAMDESLNQQALAYAELLARTGTLAHSPREAREGQGENLWAGTAGAFDYRAMARGWIDERRFYVHRAFPDVSSTGDWRDVAHYTQAIWRGTTRMGCGAARGQGRDWLVCRYAAPGNVQGQMVY